MQFISCLINETEITLNTKRKFIYTIITLSSIQEIGGGQDMDLRFCIIMHIHLFPNEGQFFVMTATETTKLGVM